MHNNYFFIRHLSQEIDSRISGFYLTECFSQQRDELILIFEKAEQQFIIQAHLSSDFSALYFPETFNKAKRNAQNLFQQAIGKQVLQIIQAENERTFTLKFEDSLELVFKLHGNRSNILLFHQKNLIKIFKPKLKKDYELSPVSLNRTADFSFNTFKEKGLEKTFFTFGKVLFQHLKDQGFEEKSESEKYESIQSLLLELNKKQFFIARTKQKTILSLIEIGEILSLHSDPIEAANALYHAHFKYNFLQDIRYKAETAIHESIRKSEEYIQKCETRLKEINTEEGPDKIADIIMANLHNIKPGTEKIRLFNFYKEEEIELKLKKNLSPQKYAELLYKKAKNRPVEIQKLNDLIDNRIKKIEELNEDLNSIKLKENYKELKGLTDKYLIKATTEKAEAEEKFKSLEFFGFRIFAGRNAYNNDELTMKFAHKDDLWLHARDVTGSHVIVKHQSGKPFPKPVIERAAEIAAFYSERKNDSLCPVIYTPKKFIRKVKGAPAGSVRVEKESVVMVVPKGM